MKLDKARVKIVLVVLYWLPGWCSQMDFFHASRVTVNYCRVQKFEEQVETVGARQEEVMKIR